MEPATEGVGILSRGGGINVSDPLPPAKPSNTAGEGQGKDAISLLSPLMQLWVRVTKSCLRCKNESAIRSRAMGRLDGSGG